MALVMLTDESAKAAAAKLGIKIRKDPKQTFARYFRKKNLPAQKVGRYWFFDVEKIQEGNQAQAING